jgi:hypothetical protein
MIDVDDYRQFATEAAFEQAVVELAGYLGWECFHVHDARRFWPGYPDWTAFRPGRHLWFELKRESGTLDTRQQVWQQRIRDAAGECYCWRPSDWLEIVDVLKGETR